MIVVDTNLIAYLLLTSERTAIAEQALRADPEWVAPLLWRSELRNVLVMQVRQGRLALDVAQAVMGQAEELMHNHEYTVSSVQVLRLAAQSGCSAYDCEFVALAETLGLRLVTVDRQVLAAYSEIALAPETFVGR